jgi:uncharacterized Zn finger protein
MDDWYNARPLKVDGGITVRSQRGQIGQKWWSRRFLQVLESFQLGGRLSRGRSYARQGQVMTLDVGHGVVRADVQGSAPFPYSVQIAVRKLTDAQWKQVESALAGAALFRAALFAGEMPPEIEDVFDACGVPLFPSTSDEITMECDCPDRVVPCKHLAAVCYVLAEQFDDDPFRVLTWRGRDREELTAAIRSLPAASATGPAGGSPAWAAGFTDEPLEERLDDFWEVGTAGPVAHELPDLGAPADGLLRALAPPPLVVRRKSLVDVLAAAYSALPALPTE